MNIKRINAIINTIYIFIPMYFLFISGKLESYKFEYGVMVTILIISLLLNLGKEIKIKKIGLVLYGYLIIHICRDLMYNDIFYFQIYKKIIISGSLAVYFFSLPFDYNYLKKLLYRGSVLYFYIFYFQFYIFYKEYLNYLTYMTIGLNLMLPTCIFLFSFFLNKKRQKRDIIYGGIFFLTILKYGNRSPILIISIIILGGVILKKNILSKKRKVLLMFLIGIMLLNLDIIVNIMSNISFIKETRTVLLLKNYYNNMGIGLLTGRDVLIEDYLLKIINKPIFGNLICSTQIERGSYSHNIIIDLLYHNGIVLGGIIIVVIIILVLKMKKNIITLTFLSLFMILMFSSYYLYNGYFYIFIILTIVLKEGVKSD